MPIVIPSICLFLILLVLSMHLEHSIFPHKVLLQRHVQSKLNHKDSCPDHVHISYYINGIQCSHSPTSNYDKLSDNVFDSNTDRHYISWSQDKTLLEFSQSDYSQLSENTSQQSKNSNIASKYTTLHNPDMSRPHKRSRSPPNLDSPESPSLHTVFLKKHLLFLTA